MGFILEIMVFLIISSMIMIFVSPSKEVMVSRNHLAKDVKQVIEDSDTQKSINNQIDPPLLIEKDQEINEKQEDKVKIIYNGSDQQASQKEYSYNDIRYNVEYTKKISKDSRWVGNISSFNYKVNNKMKIDRIVEEYFKSTLKRNGEIDIPEFMKDFKERNLENYLEEDEKEIKYNDKNKLMIIESIDKRDDENHIEIWNIEYAQIKDVNKEYGRYVIKYDIIRGQIEVDSIKPKSDEEILNGIDYDVENNIEEDIKKNRLIIQIE